MSYTEVEIDLQDAGIDLMVNVSFNVSGKYIAQTYYQPAEFPEIDLIEASHAGLCVIDILTEKNIEAIEVACWESLTEEEQ